MVTTKETAELKHLFTELRGIAETKLDVILNLTASEAIFRCRAAGPGQELVVVDADSLERMESAAADAEELLRQEWPTPDYGRCRATADAIAKAWGWPTWAERNPPDPEHEATEDADEPEQRCESGLPDCGPVTAHDIEGVPLCERCYRELVVEHLLTEQGDTFANVLLAVAGERQKQVLKGYDADHDDRHEDGELALAAAAYAVFGNHAVVSAVSWEHAQQYPWPDSDKRHKESAISRAVTGAALLIAEAERLIRRRDLVALRLPDLETPPPSPGSSSDLLSALEGLLASMSHEAMFADDPKSRAFAKAQAVLAAARRTS